MPSTQHYDVIIIGTGAGGGTLAYKLAPSGKRILILERGDYLRREKDNWSSRAVNLEGKYQAKEVWKDRAGKDLHPHTNYWVRGDDRKSTLRISNRVWLNPAERRRTGFGVEENSGSTEIGATLQPHSPGDWRHLPPHDSCHCCQRVNSWRDPAIPPIRDGHAGFFQCQLNFGRG
jgi:choline dehydrogenase-like flavoprotein